MPEIPDILVQARVGDAPPTPSMGPSFTTPAWELWPRDDGGFQVSLLRGAGNVRPTVLSNAATSEVEYHEPAEWHPESPGTRLLRDPFIMPLDQLLFMLHLAHRGAFILHAAGVQIDGVGIAIPGVSGAGKSTLSGLLAGACPGALLLSDERLVVRRSGAGFQAWGTPWMGTARVARNVGIPLDLLVFPGRGPGHVITPIPPRAAFRRMLPVAGCPLWDKERGGAVLSTLEAVVTSVPAFELRFVPEPGVGDFLRAFLRGRGRPS